MRTINVSLGESSYAVQIAAGSLAQAGTVLRPYGRGGRMLVVTDSNVAQHVAPDFIASLHAEGLETALFHLPAGEGSKNWAQLEALTDWLLTHHVERSDHIIALGGGVVGDITGFAAHIVKRGCNFIQVPTTLLAQVDSSVGGKTAINSRAEPVKGRCTLRL
ncbi:MAG: 3-dehydroquinate synthase [Pseudomonadota bacterium]